MRLGSTVVGSMQPGGAGAIEIARFGPDAVRTASRRSGSSIGRRAPWRCATVDLAALRPGAGRRRARAGAGRHRRHGGRTGASTGQKVRILGARANDERLQPVGMVDQKPLPGHLPHDRHRRGRASGVPEAWPGEDPVFTIRRWSCRRSGRAQRWTRRLAGDRAA